MRYMMLIYSQEDETASVQEVSMLVAGHADLMAQAQRVGVFRVADLLESTVTATTVRLNKEEAVITDGPFAETKEQLAGYYILDCRDLDEALEWAARIPTGSLGLSGCVEIRPIREMPHGVVIDG